MAGISARPAYRLSRFAFRFAFAVRDDRFVVQAIRKPCGKRWKNHIVLRTVDLALPRLLAHLGQIPHVCIVLLLRLAITQRVGQRHPQAYHGHDHQQNTRYSHIRFPLSAFRHTHDADRASISFRRLII
ncbi:MAG: hypothetical protein IJH03_06680 [Clostridia bacterium]|nr:hypothetical protein [Clostridia bacterium]